MTPGAYQRPIQTQLAHLAAVALLFFVLHPAIATAQPAPATPGDGTGSAPDPIAATPFRIHVHLARDPEPVVDRAWIDAQVAEANRIFAAAGVSFVLGTIAPLAERHARLETRRDRHALGASLAPGVINWFVVRSLRDVDEPGRHRMGVHWRPAGYPGKHLVIVAAHAMESVLAHELGHFFGNAHSETPGNIMSYDRGEGPPFFDEGQIRRIRRFARRFVRTRELTEG